MKKLVAGSVLAIGAVMALSMFISSASAQTRARVVPQVLQPFVERSEIGVSVRELTSDELSRAKLERSGGVFVESVRDGSPASRAGLRASDIIIEFDGERVRGVRHFSRLVFETPVGRSMRAVIVRDGARQTVDVTPEASDRVAAFGPEIRRDIERSLRRLPRDFEFELPVFGDGVRGRLGMTLTPLTDQLAAYFGVDEGVLVSAVETTSSAAQAGIRAGDVITAIGGMAVQTPAEVAATARRATPGAALDVRLVRDKKEMTLKLTVPERQPLRPGQIPI